jgi:hypothetical protein
MAGYNCGGADDATTISSISSDFIPDFSRAFLAASIPKSSALSF